MSFLKKKSEKNSSSIKAAWCAAGDVMFGRRKLRKRIEELELALEEAGKDHLTGLPRREREFEVFAKMVREAKRLGEGNCVGVILFDIDFFKRINDKYGHDVGDDVLKHVSGLLNRSVRPSDSFFRHGGEEFLMIMKGFGESEMACAVERLRDLVEKNPFSYLVNPTVSAGAVAYFPYVPNNGDASKGSQSSDEELQKIFEELIKKADILLYKAKDEGRNKVCFYNAREIPCPDRVDNGRKRGPGDSAPTVGSGT